MTKELLQQEKPTPDVFHIYNRIIETSSYLDLLAFANNNAYPFHLKNGALDIAEEMHQQVGLCCLQKYGWETSQHLGISLQNIDGKYFNGIITPINRFRLPPLVALLDEAKPMYKEQAWTELLKLDFKLIVQVENRFKLPINETLLPISLEQINRKFFS